MGQWAWAKHREAPRDEWFTFDTRELAERFGRFQGERYRGGFGVVAPIMPVVDRARAQEVSSTVSVPEMIALDAGARNAYPPN